MTVTDWAATELVLQTAIRKVTGVPPTIGFVRVLTCVFAKVKEVMLTVAEPGTPGPKELVTAAVLVMGPVGHPQVICVVTVHVTGFAQAEAKFPTPQVSVFPDRVPHEWV